MSRGRVTAQTENTLQLLNGRSQEKEQLQGRGAHVFTEAEIKPVWVKHELSRSQLKAHECFKDLLKSVLGSFTRASLNYPTGSAHLPLNDSVV